MAITLTTDPIIADADLVALLPELTVQTRRYVLINAASAAFLNFTGRKRITEGAVEHNESLPPMAVPVVWLRATPVDTDSAMTFTVLYEGATEAVLTSDDYTLEAASGRLYLSAYRSLGSDYGRRLKCEYTGGWAAVPGDVVQGALEYIRIAKERIDGRAGVQSASFEGMNTSFEVANLPTSVKDVWQRYKVY